MPFFPPAPLVAAAYPTAVVRVQATMRGFLGRKRAWQEYFSRLAMEHAGAKEVRGRTGVRGGEGRGEACGTTVVLRVRPQFSEASHNG